ncbi:hypothetical protein BDN70DRAFT_770528, partial [Pholiota conissans]
HASARNVVEQIFGVFKREFSLMNAAPEYSMDMQAKFVAALGALHNFKIVYDSRSVHQLQSDNSLSQLPSSQSKSQEIEPCTVTEEELGLNITTREKQQATNRREAIAKKMWADYQEELRRREQ